MKNLSEFIIPAYDGLSGREEIEWANFWYSKAQNPPPIGEQRILLVGDSTARMVRSTFERSLGVPVDMIGTSCGLHDILFIRQVEAFFASSLYKYSAIYIQMGHHSIRGEGGELYQEPDYERFREDYKGLLTYLRQYTSHIILLTCFLNVMPLPPKFSSVLKSIPILAWRKIKGEKIDYSWSDVVIRKNAIIKDIAEKEGLKFCDIDGWMRAQCQGWFPKYIHLDHIHYEPRAKAAIVKEYAKYL